MQADLLATHVYCFPPLENSDARLLILGSMPGVASLRATVLRPSTKPVLENHGRPLRLRPVCPVRRNAPRRCWRRTFALWDVLHSCAREGSLDAAIDKTSVMTNDFSSFFAAHPLIERVCFNGAAAESLFMRQVQPFLPHDLKLQYARLPSTSPANASIPRAEKTRAWSKALQLA